MESQNNISLNYKMDKESIIRFQILVHCYVNGYLKGKPHEKITDADISCMTLIALLKKQELPYICKLLLQYGVYKNEGSARNGILKMERKGMVVKEKGTMRKKVVMPHPDMKLVIEGDVMYQLQCWSPAN